MTEKEEKKEDRHEERRLTAEATERSVSGAQECDLNVERCRIERSARLFAEEPICAFRAVVSFFDRRFMQKYLVYRIGIPENGTSFPSTRRRRRRKE